MILNDILIVCDADGTLTDNTVLVTEKGMHRTFNMYDVEAFWRLKKSGIETVILTGSPNKFTKMFGEYYGIPVHVTDDKRSYLYNYFENYFGNNRIISFANDTMDLEMMECSVFTGCPANAWIDVLRYVAKRLVNETPPTGYVSTYRGGSGAFRDFIDHLYDNNIIGNIVMSQMQHQPHLK